MCFQGAAFMLGHCKFIKLAYLYKLMETMDAPRSVDMNFLFTLAELQRLVRAYADNEAARSALPRAMGGIAKVERTEASNSPELAEQLRCSRSS